MAQIGYRVKRPFNPGRHKSLSPQSQYELKYIPLPFSRVEREKIIHLCVPLPQQDLPSR